ncbi:Alpha/Beta hydrolase protein [Fusarium tricinctum]|uniref:Carboxylic ester hydrolase n=1 Tax=Fusarium tricinctum TaxID=61284 RepID=A0A8K0W616_9HYPO|nr:Alpha/Beta hydrolase protein [Fusarium tricinctum]
MVVTLRHQSLQTTLTGVDKSGTTQFRGITYGHIPRRFAAAEKLEAYPEELDCTAFGPRCPQVPVDVGHLLRIPPSYEFPPEPEDEFKCANLDVVLPNLGSEPESKCLPVLVWIHGGSQAVTFGSAASGICDMTTIVADSVQLGMPIIAVSIQYRLNVFALGADDGPPNLALRDQELALDWVQDHIAGFGGDPKRVTLAGESAGAVFCHAHLVAGAPARQVILSSGSLFLSPPQPRQKISALQGVVLKQLQAIDKSLSLEDAPASTVIEAVKLSHLQSFFLEWEDRFDGWQTKIGNAERLLLSDVQKEAAIWQAGVWATDLKEILAAFNTAGEHSEELKTLYHIYPDRPSSCKTGALDFINDYKFLLPIHHLDKTWKAAHKPVCRYLVDESNPWQPSSGAHHAVDLPLLFGGLDLSFSPSAENVGRAMREAWIRFVSLKEPWPDASGTCYGFGPHGIIKVLEDWEVRSRRRVSETDRLGTMDSALLDKTLAGLAAGKVSLLN